MRTSVVAVGVVVLATRLVSAQTPPEPAPDAVPAPRPEPAAPVVAPPVAPVVVAPAPARPANQVSVTYDKGLAFAAADDKFGLKLAFRNQFRFESTRPIEDNRQFASRFSIPRSRIQVEGHAFGKATKFKLELGVGDAGSFSFVRDLYVDQRLSAAPVWLRAGVWKRPFNRQELVSDFASEFNERAITAAFAGGGRDLGVAIQNAYEKSPAGLEWAVGVFNSFNGGLERPKLATTCTQNATTGTITCTTPPPSNFPADFAPAVVARAGWNLGEIKGYSEGDLEGGPLRLAVGASYKIDLGNFAKQAEASVADNLSHGLEVDAMMKVEGASAQIGLYMMKLPASRASTKSADAGFGAFAQVGYFVLPKHVEVAGRFAIAPDPKTLDRNQIEARVAVDVLWQGHAWKLASDVGILKTTGEDPATMTTDKPDLVIRSMLQLTL